MATQRYVCSKCDMIREFDTRRKRIVCPICSSDLQFNHLWHPRVVGGTFYKGDFSYTNATLNVPEGAKEIGRAHV